MLLGDSDEQLLAMQLFRLGDEALSNTGRVFRAVVSLTRYRVNLDCCPVKADVLARSLDIKPDTVKAALERLIAIGALIEHGRGLHNVRRISVPATLSPNRDIPNAA